MRNPILHDALESFAREAASALAGETASGAEVPFELVEARGGPRAAVPLYCYRPLTQVFLAQRDARLRAVGSYPHAVRALEGLAGLDAYLADHARPLRDNGGRGRAHDALFVLLERLFEERSEFDFAQSRFEAVYAELERSLYEGRAQTLVIAPLLGLELEEDCGELALGDGLSLVRGDAFAGAPPEAVWGEDRRPAVLLVLNVEDERAVAAPLALARGRFRRVLTALRLYERGGFALGPMAWARRDDGAWRTVPLGASGRPGAPRMLPASQHDELRAFVSLVSRRTPDTGEVPWALARFEMGRERLTPAEALSDYLLALRALLEPEGPASGRLAQRLATICAVSQERAALAGRTARVVALERAVIAGTVAAGEGSVALIDELGEHLRAILRDVLCGHLDADLVSLADELLAEAVDEAAAPAPASVAFPARESVASPPPASVASPPPASVASPAHESVAPPPPVWAEFPF